MWAQQLVAPRQFASAEVPVPSPGELADGEVLLRVLAGGICGSDLPIFLGLHTLYHGPEGAEGLVPGAPMHEVVGEVVASRDRRHAEGDRVVGWASRLNGLAEFTVSTGDGLATYDASLTPERAVVLQPLACVLYVAEQLPDLAGCRVAVLGQGPMGLLFNHVLRSAGALALVGVDRIDRSRPARRFGADELVHMHSSRWAVSLSDDERPDVVVEAIGHNVSSLDDAIRAVRPCGRVYYFGVPDVPSYPFNVDRMLRKNLTLISGVTRDRRRMLAAAGAYLDAHPELPSEFVTDVFDARDAQNAFTLVANPAAGTGKVTIRMSER